jgi:hypothetical protein
MQIDGACHCGTITWRATADPKLVAVCYCSDCQTFGSSAFQYAARVSRDSFQVTQGTLKAYAKLADSGNTRHYSFCADCGSGIHTSSADGDGLLSLRLGGCRQKAELPPQVQIWSGSAPEWVSVKGDVRLEKQG